MRKKFFGMVLPAFVIAAAFMFGATIARVQKADAVVLQVSAGVSTTLGGQQINLANVNVTAAMAGGTPCNYCRNQYLINGDYYAYAMCMYAPPCIG